MGSLPAGTLECLALCAGKNSYVWQPFHRVEGSNAYFGIPLPEPVRTVRWNQNNKVLASAGDEGRLQLHYAGGNLMGTLPIDPNAPVLASINSVAFSRGSKLLAAGCDDARIVIWDMKSQHQLHELQPHKGAVTSLAYDPTDNFLASTSDAGSVLLHLTSQGTQLASMPTDATPKRSLGFTHLQPLLMAGCADGSLLVWDTETTALRDSFPKHHLGNVTSACFSPGSANILVSVGRDKSLKVLDRRKGRIVASSQAPSPITCLACKDDGLYVALGTQGGVAQLYDPRKLAHSLLKFSCPGDGAVQDVHWQHTSAGKVGGRKPQPISQGDRPAHSLNASTGSSAGGWGMGVPSGNDSPGLTSALSSPAPVTIAQPDQGDGVETGDLVGSQALSSVAGIWGSSSASLIETPAQPRTRAGRIQPSRQPNGAPTTHRAAPLATPSHQGVESSMAIFSPYSAMPAQPTQDSQRPTQPTPGDRWAARDPTHPPQQPTPAAATHSRGLQDSQYLPVTAALPPQTSARDMDHQNFQNLTQESGPSEHTRDSMRSQPRSVTSSSLHSQVTSEGGDAPRRRKSRSSPDGGQQQAAGRDHRGSATPSNGSDKLTAAAAQLRPGRLGDSDPATTMGSQPTSQPSQPSHLQPGGRQQQQHSQLPHPHQNHHKANGHAAGAQTEQQPSLQKPMAGGLLGSQPSAHLLLEHPELLAHTPYVQGEDGEVPYPQTAEQTLAAQLQVQLAVEDGIAGLRDDVRSLHLDVLRNSQIQQLEMSSAMEVMQAQQDGMAQQIRQLQEQIQAVLKARDVAVWL